MKKIKLLITSAALLVGGGLLSFSANNIIKANAETIGDNPYTYEKVTSVDAFSDGGQFIFAYDNGGELKPNGEVVGNPKFMGANSGEYFTSVILNEALILNIMPVDNYFTIGFDNLFVEYHGSDNDAYTAPSAETLSAKWSILASDTSNNTFKIQNASVSNRYLQYNTGSPRFACYKDTQKDISIYEVISKKFEVTFYDGTTKMFTESVSEGDIIDFSMIDTEKDGYAFYGWYKDPEFASLYDENTPIYDDLNLYAKYVSYEDLTNSEIFESLNTKVSLKAMGTANSSKEFVIDIGGIASKTESNYYSLVQSSEELTSLIFGESNDGWKASFEKKSKTNPGFYNSDSTIRIYSNDELTFSNSNGISSIFVEQKQKDVSFDIIGDDGTEYKNLGQVSNTYTFDSAKNITIISHGSSRFKSIELKSSNVVDLEELSLRFGTNLPLDYFTRDASYGVILADGTKIAEGADLNKLYRGSTTAADYVTYLKQQNISAYQMAFDAKEIAYVSTPNSAVALDEEDPNAKYAQFAVVIDGLLEHMNQTFAAVCYMEYEGQLYLMKEARHSINSVVDAYLADEDTMSTLTDNSVAILNALNAM